MVVIFGNPGNSLVRGFETFMCTSKRNYGDESLYHLKARPKSAKSAKSSHQDGDYHQPAADCWQTLAVADTVEVLKGWKGY